MQGKSRQITGIRHRFSALKWFIQNSLNLFIMLCSVDDRLLKVFAILHWVNIILKFLYNFMAHFFVDSWISSHVYLSATLPLFIPSHVTDLLPVNLIGCNMFVQLFLFSTTYFISVLLPLSQLWDVLLPWNLEWANIVHAIVKCLTSVFL